MSRTPALAPGPMWLPWQAGPTSASEDGVLVSLTEFRPHRARHLPGAYRRGLQLRAGWYAIQGAIALSLWGQPLNHGRCGSLSVWRNESDLEGFIALPAHLAIMRRYRPLGTVQSSTWNAENYTPGAVRATAETLLRDWGAGDASTET